MVVEVDRYESPTPVRGRKRSVTPGGSTNWIIGGGDRGTPARSTGRRRSGSIASQSPSASRRHSFQPAAAPSVYHEPLWFAQTSDSLRGYNPAQSGHLPRPTALEKRHQELHPAQRAIHTDVQPPLQRPNPPHLKGTEGEWFKSTPVEAFQEETLKRELERRGHQYKEMLNEQQYQLHKAHNDKLKGVTDSCSKPLKGIAIHSKRLQEASHHHGNLWFGGVGSEAASCPSTPNRKRGKPLNMTSPNIPRRHGKQEVSKARSDSSHQQRKLDGLKSMQENDRAGALRVHKKMFPNPQTQHTKIIDANQPRKISHKTVAPFGTSSPLATDRTRKMQQLSEALSTYRERTQRTHL